MQPNNASNSGEWNEPSEVKESKRERMNRNSGDLGLYILLIWFVHVCIESTDTDCISNNPKPWAVGNRN